MRARRSLLCALCALIVPMVSPLAARADWTALGGPLNFAAGDTAILPQVADVGGVPFVAFTEVVPGADQIYVRQWNGSAWVLDGGSLNVSASDSASAPAIANVGGVPYVAWSENNGTTHVAYVKHWNGSSWVQDGSALNIVASESVTGLSIANIGGAPWVALDENHGGNGLIYVEQWNGSSWSQVGNVANTNANSLSNPSLASIGGVPYLAWSESTGGGTDQINVMSWTGSSWVAAGGPVDSLGGAASAPSLADVGGQPYVGWFYDTLVGSQQPFVSALEGAWWGLVTQSAFTVSNAGPPALAVAGGEPMFAFAQDDASSPSVHRDVRVQALHGGTWSAAGGPVSVVADNAATPALGAVAGVPVAAWADIGTSAVGVRVAALEPAFGSEQAIVTDTSAMLSVRLSDYGAPLPIALQYGAGTSLGQSTPTQTTDGSGSATLTADLTGLKPSTAYSWEPVFAPGGPLATPGPVQTFTTEPANGPGATGSPGASGAPGKVELVVCKQVTRRARHGRRHRRRKVQKCTARLVNGPVRFTTTVATSSTAR